MSMPARVIPFVLVAGLAVGLACAGPASREPGPGGGSRVASGFPKPEALQALERQSAPGDPLFRSRFLDVDAWQLAGPFPERIDAAAPRAGDRAWDPLLDELVTRRAGLVIATPAMECFAREAGRFLVENERLPGLGVQRFLGGRCALATAPPRLSSFWWESPRLRTVDAAVAELRDSIAARLREQVTGGSVDVGVWIHVAEGRVDLLVAQGQRSVRVDPVSTVPMADGRITLSGEVLAPTAQLGAVVTRGALGWDECEAAPDVALPRFHFTCQVDPEDPRAWVTLHLVPPGSILSRFGLQVLVRPGGDDVSSYRRHLYVPSHPVEDEAEIAPAFLELLNEVRGQAGAPPLELEREQSRAAAAVAPHYFQAIADPARAPIAELVALGMMAGWEVDEIIQEGRFTFMWLVESRDVASLLSDALEYPIARMTLLDADLQRLAVGAIAGREDDAEYLGCIAATYTLFSEAEHRENAERVQNNLTLARVERARLSQRPIERLRPLAVAAAARVQSGEEPGAVLGELIQASATELGRPVTGWYGETQQLDALVFPDEFLERRQLDVAIAVAFHQPRGEPWGRYVVLIVAAEPERRGV
jgi:hypothetical protein